MQSPRHFVRRKLEDDKSGVSAFGYYITVILLGNDKNPIFLLKKLENLVSESD